MIRKIMAFLILRKLSMSANVFHQPAADIGKSAAAMVNAMLKELKQPSE